MWQVYTSLLSVIIRVALSRWMQSLAVSHNLGHNLISFEVYAANLKRLMFEALVTQSWIIQVGFMTNYHFNAT